MLLFNIKDSVTLPKIDSIKGVKKTDILVSKVIHNSYSVLENYLTINNGKTSGIKSNMGVINSAGIVGIIDKTSNNYATVISVLNVKSQINTQIDVTSLDGYGVKFSFFVGANISIIFVFLYVFYTFNPP